MQAAQLGSVESNGVSLSFLLSPISIFPFLSIRYLRSLLRVADPFLSFLVVACLLSLRLASPRHHQPNGAYLITAPPRKVRPTSATITAPQPCHPTPKIPPRLLIHTSLSRPLICSLRHPLQNPTHWTMEPSLHIPERKSRGPFPVPIIPYQYPFLNPHTILPPYFSGGDKTA